MSEKNGMTNEGLSKTKDPGMPEKPERPAAPLSPFIQELMAERAAKANEVPKAQTPQENPSSQVTSPFIKELVAERGGDYIPPVTPIAVEAEDPAFATDDREPLPSVRKIGGESVPRLELLLVGFIAIALVGFVSLGQLPTSALSLDEAWLTGQKYREKPAPRRAAHKRRVRVDYSRLPRYQGSQTRSEPVHREPIRRPVRQPRSKRLSDGAAVFFNINNATDCVFDSKRERLYVTDQKQLIVLDTKKRKKVESIALPGKIRACDISPDFKYLAVAPLDGQFIYFIELETLDTKQVRFRADPSESGVYDLCIGSDNSVLFSMTYRGSGSITLRCYHPKSGEVKKVGEVDMDSIVTASGGRQYAAVAQGNSSWGELKVYDFNSHKLRKVNHTKDYLYEIACSSGARYFGRPHRKGCDLYDGKGLRLGNLAGHAVICAAFHPSADRIFIMRHKETSIQEYDVSSQTVVNTYPLDQALVISADVYESVSANMLVVGPSAVLSNVRVNQIVHFRTFQSGRLKVSDDGKRLLVVVRKGVFLFDTKKPSAKSGRGFKVIEAK